MSGEFLSVTLAAGETKTYQKAGRYFEIIADGGSTVNLTFYGDNGAVCANWLNCQSGLFLEDPWSAFQVTNNSGAAQSMVFLLMDNGRGGSRRQPGVVQVIDQSIQRTLANNQFVGNAAVNANAGNVSNASMWANGSIKKIAVRRMFISSTVAGPVAVVPFNGTGGTAVGVNGGGTNKNLSLTGAQALSDAKMCSGTTALATPTAGEIPGYGGGFRVNVQAGATFEIRFETPIVLTGNYGINVNGLSLNRDLTIAFEWEEQ